MGVLSGLQPQEFFHYFEEISNIPRGSYHEEAISNHLKSFAEARGCTVYQDKFFNLLVKVPASKGYENAAPVLFHGHLDMVLDKEPGVEKDMLKEGVDLVIDGDYIRAKGTTLAKDRIYFHRLKKTGQALRADSAHNFVLFSSAYPFSHLTLSLLHSFQGYRMA